jgi:hypothetical protein
VYIGSWTAAVPELEISKRFAPSEALLPELGPNWTSLRSGYFNGNFEAMLGQNTDVRADLSIGIVYAPK